MEFNRFMRLIVLFLVSFAILATIKVVFAKITHPKPICDKCNVVLISIDTLSALHLPCYGYERNTAPNLCRFADKNILFLNSYSQSPATLDSHFSIFTSLYPDTHKITSIFNDSLNESYLTLPQLYKLNGYKTFYYGPLNDPHLPLNRGIERGFDFINGSFKNWSDIHQQLLENIKKYQSSFFFLHTYAVHDPYLTGHKSKHPFTDQPEYPNIPLTKDEYHAFSSQLFSYCSSLISNIDNSKTNNTVSLDSLYKQTLTKLKQARGLQEETSIFNTFDENVKLYCINSWNRSKLDRNNPNQIKYLKSLYDEQIYNIDQNLGKFLNLMSDSKIAKNTIIIITSDHGEEFMEHGKLYHSTNVYRTSTQVPLIMHIPGIPPKKITELVQGIDIYPTVLGLTNLSPKSLIEGINLTELIKGNKNAPTNTYIKSEWQDSVVIQSKYLRYYFNKNTNIPFGLYNLATDPEEQNNLKDSNLEAINQFKKMLKQ